MDHNDPSLWSFPSQKEILYDLFNTFNTADILIISIVLSVMPISAMGISYGNVTAYIKDQNGDDVVKDKYLVGDLTVELWYDGKMEEDKTFNKTQDSLLFTANHTGLYTIRAKTTLRYEDTYGCQNKRYGEIAYDDVGEHLSDGWEIITSMPPRDFTVCKSKCPDGDKTVSVDRHGVYTCRNSTTAFDSLDYLIVHKYEIINEFLPM